MGRNKETLDMLNWDIAEYSSTGNQEEIGKSRRRRDKNLRVVLQTTAEIVQDHMGEKLKRTKHN